MEQKKEKKKKTKKKRKKANERKEKKRKEKRKAKLVGVVLFPEDLLSLGWLRFRKERRSWLSDRSRSYDSRSKVILVR